MKNKIIYFKRKIQNKRNQIMKNYHNKIKKNIIIKKIKNKMKLFKIRIMKKMISKTWYNSFHSLKV